MSDPRTVWRPDLGTFTLVDGGCHLSVDGWCTTHSTGAGPAWCQPASAHPWPRPEAGVFVRALDTYRKENQ